MDYINIFIDHNSSKTILAFNDHNQNLKILML